MGTRSAVARGVGLACAWGMRKALHRDATTLPGRVALAIDPGIISALAPRQRCGNMVVCGTNGKTTTNNVLAQAIEAQGMKVLCNRVGANMESGVAAALLPAGGADWGVFENDELSTVHVLPRLKPCYLLLLNLFRDQLDRCGEIDHVQEVVVEALRSSAETGLIYNADDPLCAGVAEQLRADGRGMVAFGIGEDLRLPQERVYGGGFCQLCGAPLAYEYRQYGQLGAYRCPQCGFARGQLDYAARNVKVGPEGVSFEVVGPMGEPDVHLSAAWGGVYMVYNLLAAYVGARLAGVEPAVFQRVLDTYRPQNGRLQRFDVDGRLVTLNLAKNPTGFNQNMGLLMADEVSKAVFIAVNDGYNDGRDVSWLWDVDFERLREVGDVCVYVGGTRANDLQVRLKYADVPSEIVSNVGEVLSAMKGLPPEWHLWALTNYSALWSVKADLERMGASR